MTRKLIAAILASLAFTSLAATPASAKDTTWGTFSDARP